MQLKFPMRNEMIIPEQDAVVKKVFSDTEDIKEIPVDKKHDYATIIRMGICMEESIQRLQDDCIKTNVLFDNETFANSIVEYADGEFDSSTVEKELLKRILKIKKKLAKRAKNPTGFWETFVGAFIDIFH